MEIKARRRYTVVIHTSELFGLRISHPPCCNRADDFCYIKLNMDSKIFLKKLGSFDKRKSLYLWALPDSAILASFGHTAGYLQLAYNFQLISNSFPTIPTR